jgi:signal transduction histidine kinase/ActR/RegA family two-component response regulator
MAMGLAFAISQSLVAYRSSERDAIRLQESELRTIAASVSSRLQSLVDGVVLTCGIPWSSGLLSTEQQYAEYRRLLRRHPEIVEMQGIAADSRESVFVSRIALDRLNAGDVVERLTPASSHGKVAFGETFFRDGLSPHVKVFCSEHADGHGMQTVAELNLEFTSEAVARAGERLAGDAFIVDHTGRLIAHSKPAVVFLNPRDMALAAVEGGSQWVGGAWDGKLVSSTNLESAPWRLAISQSSKAVLAPAMWVVVTTLAVALVLVAVGTAIAYGLASHLTDPIRKLGEGVAALARGELSRRAQVHSKDEIEDVAREFNRMADQLQEYTAGLERKVAEKTSDLQGALHVAHEAMRARSIFLAAASHDLRQPLYAISLLSEALAAESLPGTAATVLNKQRQAIGVLRALFDNLLDLSRFESGAIRPSPRDMPLRDLLQPLCTEYEVLAHSKKLEWRAEVADARVHTDPELFRRLAANLLSNAVRYTQDGSVFLRAEVRAEHIVVTVADTGIGIAGEDRDKVFEEFVQLANPARDRAQGVGLGLAIVKRISDLIDAEVSLESAPGQGTRISFHVPLASVVDGEPSWLGPRSHETDSLAGTRVWVVEDDPLVREGIAAQFAVWDIGHDFAEGREDVLRLHEADGGWPDAVILDDMLGTGEQGLEIASWLARSIPAERIVLVTGNVDPDRVLELERSGFVVLRKPVDSSDLAQCLLSAMQAAAPPRSAPAREPAE